MEEIEIIKPDDWHVHFRDNEIMELVAPETTKQFARAIVMPNLLPPILTGRDALRYKERIKKITPHVHRFTPLMTIYITENTDIVDLETAYKENYIFAAKLYPAGATTNSESGVKNFKNIMPVLETMARIGIPLLIHGEVTDPDIDIFDREQVFIENVLDPICKYFPDLKITLEHITTKNAVDYIESSNFDLGASITPHHLALNRNAIFTGGIKPHYYCLPILKREKHRQALLKVATSGNKKFFLGTDSAPHLIETKENSCGCAGIFNSTYSLAILTQIFEQEISLNNLEKFVSVNGANHYKMKLNSEKIKIKKQNEPIKFLDYKIKGKNSVLIFKPDFPVFWDVVC